MVGDNIKHIRVSRGLSLEDLAKRADMTKVGIWQIETGKSSPTMKSLEKIAKAFYMPVSELVSEDRERGAAIR